MGDKPPQTMADIILNSFKKSGSPVMKNRFCVGAEGFEPPTLCL